jgi:hypothetical protein
MTFGFPSRRGVARRSRDGVCYLSGRKTRQHSKGSVAWERDKVKIQGKTSSKTNKQPLFLKKNSFAFF